MTEQMTIYLATDLSNDAPAWAAGAEAVQLDSGTTRSGLYGYPCYRLMLDGRALGYAYDLGCGYEWVTEDGAEPEPYTDEERGGWPT